MDGEPNDEQPRDDGAGDEGDDLPEELDVTAYVGPYVFPDIRRRRIAAALYVVVGAGALWAGLAAGERRARVRRPCSWV